MLEVIITEYNAVVVLTHAPPTTHTHSMERKKNHLLQALCGFDNIQWIIINLFLLEGVRNWRMKRRDYYNLWMSEDFSHHRFYFSSGEMWRVSWSVREGKRRNSVLKSHFHVWTVDNKEWARYLANKGKYVKKLLFSLSVLFISIRVWPHKNR